MRKSLLIIPAAAAIGAVAMTLARPKKNLRGQVVLITGGSRGLGLAMAREFAREGCRLMLCARDAAELDRAAADLGSRGAEAHTFVCDVGDRSAVARLVEETVAHFGRLDILVNNAGVIQVAPITAMTVEDFEQAMDVMFWGMVYATLASLPHLGQGSRIVNITSIGGKIAVPHLVPYCCAKFAAVAFSEGIRAELAEKGIQVTTIAPGLMRTGSYLNAEFKGEADREAAWFSLAATLPLVSIDADRAARQVVAAAKSGRAERILTTQANLAARFHGLFPGLTTEILALVNRLLPHSGDQDRRARGADTSALRNPLISALTILGRVAAKRFLQPV
jgi:NAD(P)-dependent dehydrogenase (short-subunit alcohol dehydrogenase family)